MAQKFTVDPTLLVTGKPVSGEADEDSNASGASSSAESDTEDEAESSDEDEPVLSVEEKKKADRVALLKKLADEYEESQKDTCVACSS